MSQRTLITLGTIITGTCLFGWLFINTGGVLNSTKPFTAQHTTKNNPVTLQQLLGTQKNSPFKQATQPIAFLFPRDHGPHFAYRTEWWYLTGHLFDRNQQHYGFQFTLFRFASQPSSTAANPWLVPQFYMAHLALSNTQQQTHRSAAKFSRQGPGLAGVTSPPLQAWLENWQLQSTTAESLFPAKLTAQAPAQHIGLALTIDKLKSWVLQGNQGLSQKSTTQGNASYYYSYPRLNVVGSIQWDQQQIPVTGQAWFDHEWATSALDHYQTGWDWFSLQLENQQELMIYRIRSQPGYPETLFAGLIQADQTVIQLTPNQVTIKATQYQQTIDHKQWPVAWQITLPDYHLSLTLTPTQPNQFIKHLFTYWEGAVKITGSHQGWGFVELTGY